MQATFLFSFICIFFTLNKLHLAVLSGVPTKMYFCGVVYSFSSVCPIGVPVANVVSNGEKFSHVIIQIQMLNQSARPYPQKLNDKRNA